MATSNMDQQDTMATVNDSIIEEEENEGSACCDSNRGRIHNIPQACLCRWFRNCSTSDSLSDVGIHLTWSLRERKEKCCPLYRGRHCSLRRWYCSRIRRPTIPGAVVTKFCVRQLCPTNNC